jgi:hypothetical protein
MTTLARYQVEAAIAMLVASVASIVILWLV